MASFVEADEFTITGIQLPQLLEHLLLFESVTIRSGRFADLGHLVRLLGLDDALAVIGAPGVRIHCDPAVLVRAGEPRVRVRDSGSIRLDSLNYGIARPGAHGNWLDSGFRQATAIANMSVGRASKFENVVRGHLIPVDPTSREFALADARRDLLTVSLSVRASLDVALRAKLGVSMPPLGEYRLAIEYEASRGYSVDTDIARILALPPELVADSINAGLLGAVAVNGVLDDIRTHRAMVGMRPDELPVLNEKLSSLARQFDTCAQSERLTRVLQVVHLPMITTGAHGLGVNVRRLLEVRCSEECQAFRDWLWTSDSVNDSEIEERFGGVRAKLGSLIRSGPGRAVRWALGSGIGVIPSYGTAAGGAFSLLDTFVIERILPTRGALSFLGPQYQSIFA